MPLYLQPLYEVPSTRSMTAAFLGLNRNLRIGDGEWFDMENLTSDHAPVMAVRDRRFTPKNWGYTKPVSLFRGKNLDTKALGAVYWLDGSKLYMPGTEEEMIDLAEYGFTDDGRERQIIRMGAYVIIVPDMIYINTVKKENRTVVDRLRSTSFWTVSVTDANDHYLNFTDEKEPVGNEGYPLEEDMLWLKEGEEPVLYRYNGREWVPTTPYLVLAGEDRVDEMFTAGDTVVVSGLPYLGEAQDREHVVIASGITKGATSDKEYYYLKFEGIIGNFRDQFREESDSVLFEKLGLELSRGKIEDTFTSTATWNARVCDYDGNYARFARKAAPTNREETENEAAVVLKNGDLWHKTGEDPGLYRYDEDADEWYSVKSYLKITGADGMGFVPIIMKEPLRAGDAIRISGIHEAVNGMRLIQKVDEYTHLGRVASFIMVEGIIASETVSNVNALDKTVTIERVIPRMDFLCEAGNRLWGCRYGVNDAGDIVNEIYCSARGDFYRWIMGAAENEDSPVTFSVGADGPFTGAINYQGSPTFFKESVMFRMGGVGASGFYINEAPCMGVDVGAHKSLAVVGNVLYYKSESAVMAYDGSVPISVSERLGRLSGYVGACGGACGGKYYLSLWTEGRKATLYVLDTEKGLWHKEDDTECESMASVRDALYFVRVKRQGESVTHSIEAVGIQGALESDLESRRIPWYAETGIIGLESPDQKYVSKVAIRLRLEAGSSVRVLVQYNSAGYWKQILATETPTMTTVTMPVMPARCDHMRLRLEGTGDCKVYSITKTLEAAEEV